MKCKSDPCFLQLIIEKSTIRGKEKRNKNYQAKDSYYFYYRMQKHKILQINKDFLQNTPVTIALSGLRQFLAAESLLKMTKKAFYFTIKPLFVLKIFKLCLYFSVMQENGLIGKIKLISKFMTSQPDQQAVKINILTNISRSKENQAMQFGQLTEYHMRNIFLEESYTK